MPEIEAARGGGEDGRWSEPVGLGAVITHSGQTGRDNIVFASIAKERDSIKIPGYEPQQEHIDSSPSV